MDGKRILTIPVSELEPGMIAAKDVYSKNDQLLIGKDNEIDANSIAKVTFFDIRAIEIVVDENEEIQEHEHEKESAFADG